MSISQTTLPCGVPLIVERIEGVKSASLSWWMPAGSATDPDGQEGRASMLAEMLQRGSGERTSRQMADELDRLGILSTADTGAQFIRVSATFVGARFAECLPVIADLALRPRFDADGVEPARQLCLQALAGLADNPQARAAEILSQRHNPQPLDRSTLGTEAGLSAITREDLIRGWEQRCRPQQSIITLAGDVELGPIAEVLSKATSGWSGATPPLSLGASPHRGTYHHEQEETNQVQIYLAHAAPAEHSPDARLERVVTSVLSGGSSARLFSEVREKRALCYSVFAGYASDKLFGRTTGYVGTTPEKAQLALDVMLEQLRGMTGPAATISQDEFDRARIGYKSSLVASGESSGARASALASDWHRLGRTRSLGELASEMESLSLDQVNAYAKRRSLGPITIVTLGPRALKA